MVAPETYVGAALAANAIWTLLDQRRYEDILPYLTPDCAWHATQPMNQPYILGDVDLEFVQSDQRVLIARISVHQAFAIEALIK